MSAKSTAFATKVIADVLSDNANLFIRAHTGDPGAAGTSNEVGTGGGTLYAAIQVAAADWTNTSGVLTNDEDEQFPEAGASWGTLSHLSIHTHATSATCIYKGALATPVAIGAGDTATIAADAIEVTET